MSCELQTTIRPTRKKFISICRNIFLSVLVLVVLVMIAPSLLAVSINHESNHPLARELSYLFDETNSFTTSELITGDHHWDKLNSDIMSFGFVGTPIWLRVEINNTQEDSLHKILEIPYPVIDYLDVFVIHEGKTREKFSTGDKRLFSTRSILHRDFLFPIELVPGQSTLLIKVQTSGSLQVPLKLWNTKSYWEKDQAVTVGQGVYYGIIFVMATCSLFIFALLRETTYLYYVFYASFFGLFQASLRGLSFQFLWPTHVWWHDKTIAIFINLAIMFGLMFTTSFLMLNKQHPRLDRVFKVCASLTALAAICSLFLPFSISIRLAAAWVLPTVSMMLGSGIYSWYRGQRSARLFVIAWTTFILGALALALNKFGVLPRTFLTESGIQIGSAIEIILLSMALADRINEERNQKAVAQNALTIANEKARAKLESRVAERTEALENAMSELSSVNKRLEQLSTTDSLTNVYNRRYFDDYLTREWQRGMRTQLPLSLLLIDIDKFKAINDTYGHVVGDECIQQVAETISHRICRTNDIVARYGGEEFAVILPHVKCQDAAKIAESLRIAIAGRHILIGDKQIQITASFGVACMTPSHETSADKLITYTDNALYAAKRNGRNRVELSTEASEHLIQ